MAIANLVFPQSTRISNVAEPTVATDAATKNYVDTRGGGSGTVTSITAGTGLSGGTITTSGTISLIPPTTSVIGGVKATANPGLQFVNGVTADGTLSYGVPLSYNGVSFSGFTNVGAIVPNAQNFFNLNGDRTAIFPAGARVTFNSTGTGTIYTVLRNQFSGGITAVTLTGQITENVADGAAVYLATVFNVNTLLAGTGMTFTGSGNNLTLTATGGLTSNGNAQPSWYGAGAAVISSTYSNSIALGNNAQITGNNAINIGQGGSAGAGEVLLFPGIVGAGATFIDVKSGGQILVNAGASITVDTTTSRLSGQLVYSPVVSATAQTLANNSTAAVRLAADYSTAFIDAKDSSGTTHTISLGGSSPGADYYVRTVADAYTTLTSLNIGTSGNKTVNIVQNGNTALTVATGGSTTQTTDITSTFPPINLQNAETFGQILTNGDRMVVTAFGYANGTPSNQYYALAASPNTYTTTSLGIAFDTMFVNASGDILGASVDASGNNVIISLRRSGTWYTGTTTVIAPSLQFLTALYAVGFGANGTSVVIAGTDGSNQGFLSMFEISISGSSLNFGTQSIVNTNGLFNFAAYCIASVSPTQCYIIPSSGDLWSATSAGTVTKLVTHFITTTGFDDITINYTAPYIVASGDSGVLSSYNTSTQATVINPTLSQVPRIYASAISSTGTIYAWGGASAAYPPASGSSTYFVQISVSQSSSIQAISPLRTSGGLQDLSGTALSTTQLLLGSGTSTVPAGTAGQILTSQGPGSAPTWTTGGGGGGGISSITAGTGLSGGTITTSGTIALLPSTSAVIGGVKATANPGNQFVNGVAADGTLNYGVPVSFNGATDSGVTNFGAIAPNTVSVFNVGGNQTSLFPAGTRVTFSNTGVLGTVYTVTQSQYNGSTLTAVTVSTQISDTVADGQRVYFVTAYNINSIAQGSGSTLTASGNTLYVAATAIPSGVLPQPAGTADFGTSTRYARGDHIHPFSVTTTGTSGAATYDFNTGILNVPQYTGGGGGGGSGGATTVVWTQSTSGDPTPASTPYIINSGAFANAVVFPISLRPATNTYTKLSGTGIIGGVQYIGVQNQSQTNYTSAIRFPATMAANSYWTDFRMYVPSVTVRVTFQSVAPTGMILQAGIGKASAITTSDDPLSDANVLPFFDYPGNDPNPMDAIVLPSVTITQVSGLTYDITMTGALFFAGGKTTAYTGSNTDWLPYLYMTPVVSGQGGPVISSVTSASSSGFYMFTTLGLQGSGATPATTYSWVDYENRWTSTPLTNATAPTTANFGSGAVTVSGTVINYPSAITGGTIYRLNPSPYTPQQDAFFTTFSGGALTGYLTNRAS